jgi:hypothetical protein
MSVVGTAVPAAQSASIRARFSNVLPLAGIALALIANAAWVGFLAYCIVRLI